MEITMDLEKFETYGIHFCNLGSESTELFDIDGIDELQDNELVGNAVYMLSQYIVGNQSEPLKQIKKMSSRDREITISTWLNVIKDPEELRMLTKYFISL